ncbi:MAG: hypothetical protein ACXVUE_10735 [Solirubrobacteraceae bacterium]
MGDQVVLLLLREDDLPMPEKLTQAPARTGEFAWPGPRKKGASESSPEDEFEKPRQPAPSEERRWFVPRRFVEAWPIR